MVSGSPSGCTTLPVHHIGPKTKKSNSASKNTLESQSLLKKYFKIELWPKLKRSGPLWGVKGSLYLISAWKIKYVLDSSTIIYFKNPKLSLYWTQQSLKLPCLSFKTENRLSFMKILSTTFKRLIVTRSYSKINSVINSSFIRLKLLNLTPELFFFY